MFLDLNVPSHHWVLSLKLIFKKMYYGEINTSRINPFTSISIVEDNTRQ